MVKVNLRLSESIKVWKQFVYNFQQDIKITLHIWVEVVNLQLFYMPKKKTPSTAASKEIKILELKELLYSSTLFWGPGTPSQKL